MRVYLESLGCRLNAAEVQALARRFAGAGHDVVTAPARAGIVVLNTCAVTSQASRRSRHRLRSLHRESPSAQIAVTGCWATEDPARAERFAGVAWCIPNSEKPRAVHHILGQASEPAPWAPGRWGHTRAFLGVQYGCNHTCTYCVTRVLRGPAWSRPVADTVADVRDLVSMGAQEVVLTGVSLGSYGRDRGMEDGLFRLVTAILRETDLPWLRLSSIEPWDVTPKLLSLWGEERVCRQLHVPLQSGSDAVLRRMGRRITSAAYANLVESAYAVCPDLAVTTDLIAGFPGETHQDHQASLQLVAALGLARLHVFPYSERPGTPAAKLPGPTPVVLRRERAGALRGWGRRLSEAYRRRFVDQVLPVLWLNQDDDGRWMGLTDNYLTVRARSRGQLHNRISSARLSQSDGPWLLGEVVSA